MAGPCPPSISAGNNAGTSTTELAPFDPAQQRPQLDDNLGAY